jgi:hypothetical protein
MTNTPTATAIYNLARDAAYAAYHLACEEGASNADTAAAAAREAEAIDAAFEICRAAIRVAADAYHAYGGTTAFSNIAMIGGAR